MGIDSCTPPNYPLMKSFSLALVLPLLTVAGTGLVQAQPMSQSAAPLYQNAAYAVYPDRVVQGKMVAKALSATQLESNYQSPASGKKDPWVPFKFSINGKDNEMAPGVDHLVYCVPAAGKTDVEVPLITFGKQYKQAIKAASGATLKPNTPMRIRLDMRPVLEAFKKQGFYTLYNGDKLYAADFKGVWVAGGSAPLVWDFDNLQSKTHLQLKDQDNDGIYELSLTMNGDADRKLLAPSWQMKKDATAFAQYKSPFVLHDALYNLALEEMMTAVEPDSTFRTGKEWAGVWTRDISYSIILAMASQQPRVAMTSLRRKVKNKRIIQDTGTGGAYPVSTDRMVWAAAAWEIYLATGDMDWLREAYEVVRNSIQQDMGNGVIGPDQLAKGESSFLDWREQTYPRWMEPADIYESQCLGTNAVHVMGLSACAFMTALVENDANKADLYRKLSKDLTTKINEELWLPQGYYAQYRYGRAHKMVSPRAEALGQALLILCNMVPESRQKQAVESMPVGLYGIPCIYPQIPGIPPYHNNGIWPFVQSYWALAAARVGNEGSFMGSLAAIMRPAALFLTNKENMVAEDGDYAGTQVNSSVMLWSLSGMLGVVHKGIFGIRYQTDGIAFSPFVPKALTGTRSLTNFKYHKATLDITLIGHGSKIARFEVDGVASEAHKVSNQLQGRHSIRIVLSEDIIGGKENLVPNLFTPEIPEAKLTEVAGQWQLTWAPTAGAKSYVVLVNGKPYGKPLSATAKSLTMTLPRTEGYAEAQVMAVDAKGVSGFASAPLLFSGPTTRLKYGVADVALGTDKYTQGANQKRVVEIGVGQNTAIRFNVTIKEKGSYAFYFRYANGNGPVNTENKCAIRTLKVAGQQVGTLVFPQRGKDEWADWGLSNKVVQVLEPGTYNIELTLEPANENMNGAVNHAVLDELIIDKMAPVE